MSDAKELQILTAFGASIDTAMIIAVHPDERAAEPKNHRSIVLKITNGSVQVVETLSQPIYVSWLSTSGAAYCPTHNGQVVIRTNGAWEREQVCDRDVRFGDVFGFCGAVPRDDIVFVSSDESLFIRTEGVWKEHAMPQTVEIVRRIHGLSQDQVYITTDEGLLCWNGSKLVELEGPECEPSGVLVISETEMLVTGGDLFYWSDETGWETLASPAERHTIALVPFGEVVFIGTANGVLQYCSGELELVTDCFCNNLMNIGTGVVASGDANYLFDKEKWIKFELPILSFMEPLK